MIEVNPARFITKPFRHQIHGTIELVRRRSFALFDEMGSGKSKQVIDAACVLYEAGEIDCVVVVAPASVRSVWLDEELGQIKAHSWVPATVIEYHSEMKLIWSDTVDHPGPDLPWFVTNYEFLRPIKEDTSRRDDLLANLKSFSKIFLVLDESSMVKSNTSQQFKAALELRGVAARCVILNGTPVSNNPLDLWAQMEVLDKRILGGRYKNFFVFKRRHCLMGGWHEKQILGWRDLEKVQALIKPYCLRRLKKDCLDLPPKIGGIDAKTPIIREVKLKKETWTRYKRLRQEALLALPNRNTILEPNAAVRVMRLAQLTSGHIAFIPELTMEEMQLELFAESQIEFLSSEKLDDTFTQLTEWSTAEATIVWCRFRPERERLVKMLEDHGVTVYQLYGGMPKKEKDEAERAFHPSSRGSGRRIMVAQPHAGGKGLQLHAATENIYLSNDHSLEFRLQSEDRTHRSGTIEPVSYGDVLATGPEGQKTIDHVIFKALRAKQDLAVWTCAAWRRALGEE